MAGTKITDLPVSNTAENAKLIANVNGQATQIPASTVGAQPDWNETDETKPAFILNKPETSPGYIHYRLSNYSRKMGEYDVCIITKDDGKNLVTNISEFITNYQKAPIFFDRVGSGYGGKGSPCLGISKDNIDGVYYTIVYALSEYVVSDDITLPTIHPFALAYHPNTGDML